MILDKNLIQKINLFENLTKARIKDVFNDGNFVIVVHRGEVGKAIGKDGVNIKKYSSMINEKVKIVEFDENPIAFFKNLVMPLKVYGVDQKDGFINVNADTETKALLIGRNQKNLEQYNKIFKKYFDINIKVK